MPVVVVGWRLDRLAAWEEEEEEVQRTWERWRG